MVNKKSALDSDVVLSSIMHILSILLATENTPIQYRKLTAQLAKFLPLPVVTPEVIVWQFLCFSKILTFLNFHQGRSLYMTVFGERKNLAFCETGRMRFNAR